jgi:TRAP-type C4-dicarboxylate transport system substrate-binding protein
MPFAELYGALEASAVDGQENPYSVILSNKFYEVNKYVSATNHVIAMNIRADQQALLGQAVGHRAEAC